MKLSTPAYIFISVASALFVAGLPVRASAAYLPEYQGPTFEHITDNVRSLAVAYQAPAVAMTTHLETTSISEAEPVAEEPVSFLAYLPQALYETAEHITESIIEPVAQKYAEGLLWVGDLQASSYKNAAALIEGYNESFEGLSDAQMTVYTTVGDSLARGLSTGVEVAHAASDSPASVWDSWTSWLASGYYPPPAAVDNLMVPGGVAVATITVVTPVKDNPQITHQRVLCVGESGAETCITKDELDTLLAQAHRGT